MKYAVPLVVTAGLCWLLFTTLDFSEMMSIISTHCSFGWIVAALAVSVFSHIFRAMRWGIQLRALGINPPLYALVYSIFGTYAVNLVVPRLGEVWRTGYIAQRQDAPFSAVFGSMIADRLADTITVLLITLVTFALASTTIMAYLAQNAPMWHKIAATVASPVFWIASVAALALLIFLLIKIARMPVLNKVRTFVRGLWQGFAVIASMRGKGAWLLLTVCVWGCYFLQLWLAFYSFPFTTQVIDNYGFLAVLVTFVLSSIAMGVPSNGGIGPWQWAVIFALGIYQVPQAPAGAFANLVLGTNTLLLIVLGIITFCGIALDKKRSTSHNLKNDINTCQKS